ncbi:hypothetical protein [Kordia sp.]|uniref:hypothetical protein n=1 Tax=Kordia sp. TaxID=1965332 RepID=UPI003D280789
MKEKKLIGIETPTNFKLIKLDVGEKIFEDHKNVKSYLDWIKEFLVDEKIFEAYNKKLFQFLHKSLPKETQNKCNLCFDKKDYSLKCYCEYHIIQMYGSFALAGSQFVEIVLSNQFIFEDKKVLFDLTKQFFTCFHFIMGKGAMYYDQDIIVRYCVNANLNAIAEVFKKSDPVENIKVSNETLNNLNKEVREDKFFEREDFEYKPFQQGFFSEQIEINKNRHFVVKESKNQSNKTNKNDYSFINLFKSKEIYKKAIKTLKNNGFIAENKGVLNWVFTETKELKTKQTIIALCVVLEIKQYFKPSPKAVYNYLEYEFGIKMNKSTYSRSSDGFKDDYENEKSTNYTYTSLFKDIL